MPPTAATAVQIDLIVSNDILSLSLGNQPPVDSLEHVLHVGCVDEGVIDGHDVHHGVLEGGAEDQTADAAEAVDADGHRAHRLSYDRPHDT